VLDGAADAHRYVQLRRDNLARLAHLLSEAQMISFLKAEDKAETAGDNLAGLTHLVAQAEKKKKIQQETAGDWAKLHLVKLGES
jgi:hypothetical protein